MKFHVVSHYVSICDPSNDIFVDMWHSVCLLFFHQHILIGDFIHTTDPFHSSPYPHFKTFNLLLSVCVNIHVSAVYSATLQTEHFIILFFISRFSLSVNSIFLSRNTLPSQFYFGCLFHSVHPLISICLSV